MTMKTQPRPKHVPQRTCIACRSTEAKRGLVRVVRTPAGAVEVDLTGKKAGRGAYVHSSAECWQEALKKDRLSRALHTSLGEADREALRRFAEDISAATAPVGA